ncbi:hypothetical protein EYF80_063278 [Liparis tanakae]|uniref:Uncharacterized protein n=1 Tax=Liparis tanakae TaxID=230148 RepID=A0A4Z2ECK1_9TELE|nr:hypothetical protein EYF80_063278 [Liparis tanakae]
MWMCIVVMSLEMPLKQGSVSSSSQHVRQFRSLSHGAPGRSAQSWKKETSSRDYYDRKGKRREERGRTDLQQRGDGAFQEVLPLGIRDLPALPHDLDAQHEAVDELVLLEEAAGHVDVGVEQDLVQQDLEAVFQHAALLRRLDERLAITKYKTEPLVATGRYRSRAELIISSVASASSRRCFMASDVT